MVLLSQIRVGLDYGQVDLDERITDALDIVNVELSYAALECAYTLQREHAIFAFHFLSGQGFSALSGSDGGSGCIIYLNHEQSCVHGVIDLQVFDAARVQLTNAVDAVGALIFQGRVPPCNGVTRHTSHVARQVQYVTLGKGQAQIQNGWRAQRLLTICQER